MFRENTSFSLPGAETVLWRYMDFSKYLSLLEKQALYFSRADILQGTDPYEGSQTMPEMYNEELNKRALSLLYPSLDQDIIDNLFERLPTQLMRNSYINCWHMKDYENLAMWRVYTQANTGIAIKTNFEDLKRSLQYAPESVWAGVIRYVDFLSGDFPQAGPIDKRLLRKSRYYEYENELRLMYNIEPPLHEKSGIDIHVDLDVLIHEIYVDPKSETWFRDLVESVYNTYAKKHSLKRVPFVRKSPISYNEALVLGRTPEVQPEQLADRVREMGDYNFFGHLPRDDQYFVHFEQTTGKIIEVYRKQMSDNIPEPNIQITFNQWIAYLECKNKYCVDLESKLLRLS